MKTLLALCVPLLFTFTAFGADNLYTRVDYPAPRIKQTADSRIFPVMVAYQSDGNGVMSPIGPIVSGSWKYATPIASPISTTGAVVLKAATALVTNYVSSLSLMNTSATGTVATIKDGSTVVWTGYLGATTGQVIVRFDPPLKGTVSTDTNFVLNTSGANVYMSAQGFVR